jgi:uncharacterized protein
VLFLLDFQANVMIAVNVSQLLKLPAGSTREFKFSDDIPELGDELSLVGPVEGQARLLRTSRGILAATQYRTLVEMPCGRCLEPTAIEIEGSSADEFIATVDVVTGLQLADHGEPDELTIDDHHVLDLSEVLRQDILTRLPLQHLQPRRQSALVLSVCSTWRSS